MMKYCCYLLSVSFLLNGCSKETKPKSIGSTHAQQLILISEKLEKAFWTAEDKRVTEASKSKSKYTDWKTFEKEHEVKIEGIHTSDATPPVYTGVIRLINPSIKDSYYEFHFEYSKDSWLSTEAFISAPNRQHDFYRDPFPNSKSLKEYFPEELKKLGAPVVVE
jgi:hypothetical protein